MSARLRTWTRTPFWTSTNTATSAGLLLSTPANEPTFRASRTNRSRPNKERLIQREVARPPWRRSPPPFLSLVELGDTKLGARPHERHGDNDLPGRDGAWGSDL